ncbi:hypothetical protein ACIRPT_26495 [Streptomyces sp. NPDC101227]|uniref:hypothetical protein n=1 Tax=Streptomyces sp. NPDC101227 TaxID=3366136 RepID=UPI0037FA3983
MSGLDDHDCSPGFVRVAASFTACRKTDSPALEHAMAAANETLCGIPRDQVTVYRHLFFPRRRGACGECRERAVGAPTEPGPQERLYHRVKTAVPGCLREELLAALRSGADVRLWVNGPTEQVIRHYAQLDRIVEGAEAIEAVVRGDGGRLGLARVVHGAREFVVFLPEDGAPLVTAQR